MHSHRTHISSIITAHTPRALRPSTASRHLAWLSFGLVTIRIRNRLSTFFIAITAQKITTDKMLLSPHPRFSEEVGIFTGNYPILELLEEYDTTLPATGEHRDLENGRGLKAMLSADVNRTLAERQSIKPCP